GAQHVWVERNAEARSDLEINWLRARGRDLLARCHVARERDAQACADLEIDFLHCGRRDGLHRLQTVCKSLVIHLHFSPYVCDVRLSKWAIARALGLRTHSFCCADDVPAEQSVEAGVELRFRRLAPDLRRQSREVVGLDLREGTAVAQLDDEAGTRIEIIDLWIVRREGIAAPPFLETPQHDVVSLRVAAVAGEHGGPLLCWYVRSRDRGPTSGHGTRRPSRGSRRMFLVLRS